MYSASDFGFSIQGQLPSTGGPYSTFTNDELRAAETELLVDRTEANRICCGVFRLEEDKISADMAYSRADRKLCQVRQELRARGMRTRSHA